MAIISLIPPPIKDSFFEDNRNIAKTWLDWFTRLNRALQEIDTVLTTENPEQNVVTTALARIETLERKLALISPENVGIHSRLEEMERTFSNTAGFSHKLEELERIFSIQADLSHKIEELRALVETLNQYRPPNLPFYLGEAVEFEQDGTLLFKNNATVWDDVFPSGVSVALGSGAPSFTAYGGSNLKAYEFVGAATAKNIHMVFQIPHKYKEGSTITPHLHLFVPDDGTGGDIRFTCEYQWSDVGDTGALSTTTLTNTLTVGASAGIYQNQKFAFDSIVGTGKNISSLLQCLIERDPTNGADTFGSSVWLLSADVHCELNTVGSRLATSK